MLRNSSKEKSESSVSVSLDGGGPSSSSPGSKRQAAIISFCHASTLCSISCLFMGCIFNKLISRIFSSDCDDGMTLSPSGESSRDKGSGYDCLACVSC